MLDFARWTRARSSSSVCRIRNRTRARDLVFLPERFVPPYYLTGTRLPRVHARAPTAPLRCRRGAGNDCGARSRTQRARKAGPIIFQRHDAETGARGVLSGTARPLRSGRADERTRSESARMREERCSSSYAPQGARCSSLRMRLRTSRRSATAWSILHQGVPYFAGAPRALCEHYGESSMEQAFLRCVGGC